MADTSRVITPEQNPFFERQEQPAPQGRKILNYVQGLVVVIFVGILIYLFVATPNQVDGSSMFPNFEDDQILLTNRIPQWLGGTPLAQTLGVDYQRGDVVVVDVIDVLGEVIIKRIIGIPGDQVAIMDGSFYINGRKLDEDYIADDVPTRGGTFLATGGSVTVPAGYFFISGDNRTNSLDSRYNEIGFVPRARIQGKPVVRLWPPASFTFISRGKTELL